MLKSPSLALLAVAMFLLTGCQSRVAPAVDPQVRQTFVSDMQQALKLGIATADTDKQVGVVMLTVFLDRYSAPTSCKASKAPLKYEMQLPADVKRSDFKSLASLVEAQCWKTIYPVVPDGLREVDGTVEVRAPMFVLLPAATQAPGTPRRQANAQREYFWQHLLRDQPVNSIGRVSVYYQANAQGKVEDCLVQIYPHPLRPNDFRLDGKLQAQLNSRCLAMDLSRLPGFSADMHGVAKGYSELEYAPWRVGRQ
ncbi:hypothetical protein C2H86_08480 [Pseudomonas putida]|uniref:Lipoprotein n=2 Tax=Pseudomonas putida TaxID=303 RepID=A0A6I6XFH5_PSEPU|nr:hypothetical protein C2H86_08480 [Pseudomonas putida]